MSCCVCLCASSQQWTHRRGSIISVLTNIRFLLRVCAYISGSMPHCRTRWLMLTAAQLSAVLAAGFWLKTKWHHPSPCPNHLLITCEGFQKFSCWYGFRNDGWNRSLWNGGVSIFAAYCVALKCQSHTKQQLHTVQVKGVVFQIFQILPLKVKESWWVSSTRDVPQGLVFGQLSFIHPCVLHCWGHMSYVDI